MTDPNLIDPDTGRRHRPGRATLLTDDLTDRIAQVVGAGNYLKVAAQFAGVSQASLHAWLARGRRAAALVDADGADALPAGERLYLTFLEAVTRAETEAEVAAVTHWRRAFGTDWRAARDFLVRSKPDRWAATTRIAISSEEAEARIERATLEALTSLGVDTDGLELPPGDDPAGLAADLDADLDGDDDQPGDF